MQKYFIGSVLSGGDSDPKEGNSLQAWTDFYDNVQSEALKTRLAIPILYGIDAVHGHSNVLGAVMFPHNIALGCTRDPALVEKIGRITAKEVRATGIQWTFAPCVTVPQDIRWGRTYEGFSEDPALVRSLGEAAVRGMQGRDLTDPLVDSGLRQALRRRRRHGGEHCSTSGTGSGKCCRTPVARSGGHEGRRSHAAPHSPAGIYVSHQGRRRDALCLPTARWNGVRCSGSKRLLTEILKQELGFEGFLISDYNAISQIKPGDYKTSVEISINAGMDMAMEPSNYRNFFNTLKELVTEGKVPMSRIDDAVTRILRVKFAMGLMDKDRSQLADRKLHSSLRIAGAPGGGA